MGAIDEGQVRDENPREVAAVLFALLSVAQVGGLAAKQLEENGAGALRPIVGIGLEHAPHQLGHNGTGGMQQCTRELGAPVSLHSKHLAKRLAGKRPSTANRRVHRCGERIDVRARIGGRTSDLLGRREPWRAQDRDRVFVALLVLIVVRVPDGQWVTQHSREAEVDELCLRG